MNDNEALALITAERAKHEKTRAKALAVASQFNGGKPPPIKLESVAMLFENVDYELRKARNSAIDRDDNRMREALASVGSLVVQLLESTYET